jgi:hypothetical protein
MTLLCRVRRSLGFLSLGDYGVEEARHRAVVEVLRMLFGLRSVRGLADILSGSVCLEVVSQELLLDPKKFAVVPAPPDSAQLLKPKRVSRFWVECVSDSTVCCAPPAQDSRLIPQVLPCGETRCCLPWMHKNTYRCASRQSRAYATQKP